MDGKNHVVQTHLGGVGTFHIYISSVPSYFKNETIVKYWTNNYTSLSNVYIALEKFAVYNTNTGA